MPKLGSTFTKVRKFSSICIFCGTSFKVAEPRANRCSMCRTLRHPCACGCGRFVRGAHRRYIQYHAVRDPKNTRIRLGHLHQSFRVQGANNPAKRSDVREKISAGVKKSWGRSVVYRRHCVGRRRASAYGMYTNPVHRRHPYGHSLFRSGWEVAFARWCRKRHLHYRYESKTFVLPEDGRCYTPDFFLIDHNLFVEIKGRIWSNLRSPLEKVKGVAKEFGVGICVLFGTHLRKLEVLP